MSWSAWHAADARGVQLLLAHGADVQVRSGVDVRPDLQHECINFEFCMPRASDETDMHC